MGSSGTRARTCVPCIGRQILNHCTTREAPKYFITSYSVDQKFRQGSVGMAPLLHMVLARATPLELMVYDGLYCLSRASSWVALSEMAEPLSFHGVSRLSYMYCHFSLCDLSVYMKFHPPRLISPIRLSNFTTQLASQTVERRS